MAHLGTLIKPQPLFQGRPTGGVCFSIGSHRKAGGVTESGPGKVGGQALPTGPHSFWACLGGGSEFPGALVTAAGEAHVERAGEETE